MAREDIAIIGMAGLFPQAADLDAFWSNLVTGRDAITEAPADDPWGVQRLYDPAGARPGGVYCNRGGFLGELSGFDPSAYGVLPRAVDGSNPGQWLALQAAAAALADAGYGSEVPERERAAVVIGHGLFSNRGSINAVQHATIIEQTLDLLAALHPEYSPAEIALLRRDLHARLPHLDADTLPGIIPNVMAARLADRLDLMGPSYTVDAACASALVALELAVRHLQSGQCDLALVGAVQVFTCNTIWATFCELGAFSRRQIVRPFDRDSDGTLPGEGVGMVVLKRLDEAQREGRRIYAVIKGVGVSSNGRGASLMAPRLEGEVLALRRAYADAGVPPQSVELVEAHGLGTPLGDAVEVASLAKVFGPRPGELPTCALGSVKSMIGHVLAASGMAGLIKTALALYHKVLPPTLNVTQPHPALELEKTPFYLNTTTRPWVHDVTRTPRRAGVSSLGFGGINAHAVLEEAPGQDELLLPTRLTRQASELCLFSADSREALLQRLGAVADFLAKQPPVALKDLAYTLNVAEQPGPARLAVVAESLDDLAAKLADARERLHDPQGHALQGERGLYYAPDPPASTGGGAQLLPEDAGDCGDVLADLCLHFPQVRGYFDRAPGRWPPQAGGPEPGLALAGLLRDLGLAPEVALGEPSGDGPGDRADPALSPGARGRAGLTRLHHLLGLLATRQVPMKLDALYARRSPRRVNLNDPRDPYGAGEPSRTTMRVQTSWPGLTLSAEVIEQVRRRPRPAPAESSAAPELDLGPGVDRAEAMAGHLDRLTQLLEAERETMRAYFAAQSAAEPPDSAGSVPWAEAERLAGSVRCYVNRATRGELAPLEELLSRRERQLLEDLRYPEPRREQWLLGRAAAKGAVRRCLDAQPGLHGVGLDEIEILPDPPGCPAAHGPWEEQLGRPVLVSLSHTGDLAVAVATAEGAVGGLGLDLERVDHLTPDVREVAFTKEERELLRGVAPEQEQPWLARLWCAKEATAKALGCQRPAALRVTAVEVGTGLVTIATNSLSSQRAATLAVEGLALGLCVRVAVPPEPLQTAGP